MINYGLPSVAVYRLMYAVLIHLYLFFRPFLQVHVCLLVCEARLQAELLYGLRAVSEHYNFQA